jgi:peptidoglycan hydrolase-like protein with peptidoglycan-binding domain
MATLRNHPGYYLRDDAAAAFDRAEAAHGIFRVNDARRTVAEQNALIARWNRGGASNRPPYLYEPANPPETSNHVKNGGIAVDLGDWQRFATIAGSFGFSHPYPGGDPVHFEYVGGGSSGGSSVTSINDIGADYVRKLQTQLGVAVDGDAGNETNTALQRRLGVTADGIFGPDSTTALQRYTGATPDGIWGPQSIGSLKATIDIGAFSPNYGKPAGDPDVLAAQKLLNRFGYKLDEDGDKGPATFAAIRDFQSKNGLEVDGIFGDASTAKANALLAGGTTPPVTPPTPPVTRKAEAAGAKWVGSPNFTAQTGVKKNHATLHWMVGYLAGTDSAFKRPGGVSTTYGVGLTAVHQYVLEKDYAYGDGNADSNRTGISIEHEGGYLLADGVTRQTPVKATLDLSAKLLAELAVRHGWGKVVWMGNVFPHKHYVATACPGTLDYAYIIAEANRINGYDLPPVVVPPVPNVLVQAQAIKKLVDELVDELSRG